MPGTHNAELTWKALITDLSTWKRGDQRAVHKPLLTLLLLARAQRGEGGLVPYAEVHAPIKKVLHDFGPPRKSYHPEYPFWYLRSDGFWDVQGAEDLVKRKGKDEPTHRALLDADAQAVVPEGLWGALLDQPELVVTLALELLEEFFEDSTHDAIVSAVGLDIDGVVTVSRRRPRDPRFRDDVLRAWSSRCAICGFDARLGDTLFGIDAAHIHSHRYQGPAVVQNGLALCSLHHRAFDFGAVSVSDDMRVMVSEEVSGHDAVGDTLLRYAGSELQGLIRNAYRPGESFVRWHQREVFRGPARA
jgi:putative restriction endonuclease